MKAYFFTQCKRAAKLFPILLLVTVILLTGSTVILSEMLKGFSEKEENSIIHVGVAGDTENDYLRLGLAAFQSVDETRYTLDMKVMEEEVAKEKIARGEITAYLVIPDNFFDLATDPDGEILPLRYVTTAGAENLFTSFKDEFVRLITDLILASEKGSWAIHEASNDYGDEDFESMSALSVEYVEMILNRGNAVVVEELGISAGLDTTSYYLCGILLLFLLFSSLPFAALYAKNERPLHCLHLSKGKSVIRQVLCEWGAFCLCLLALLGVVLGGALLIPQLRTFLFPGGETETFLLMAIPVTILISLFSFFIFECAENPVSGALIHFFLSLALTYLSGSFYPLYAFPVAMQKAEAFLPTSPMRKLLAFSFTGEVESGVILSFFLYALLFFVGAYLSRKAKLTGREEVAG